MPDENITQLNRIIKAALIVHYSVLFVLLILAFVFGK